MDLILRNARIGAEQETIDIGIDGGRIAAIEPKLAAEGETIDLAGRLVTPPFVETHIHLDKSNILDRCKAEKGDLEEAIGEVAKAKQGLHAGGRLRARAKRTLERCILHGTMHMRTHLEVDPGIGLRSLEGVLPLIDEYKWAIDIEICIFPQEGLLNNPGTDELMVAALKRGGSGGRRRALHGLEPARADRPRVRDGARVRPRHRHASRLRADAGRHGSRLCLRAGREIQIWRPRRDRPCHQDVGGAARAVRSRARRMADAGVALTVLPSTDLYLMGRHMDHSVMRGVTPAHKLLHCGVNCSLSTNNVLNPFTPFGDCSLVRMANLYANICQVGAQRRHPRMFQHGHDALRKADAAEGLWPGVGRG